MISNLVNTISIVAFFASGLGLLKLIGSFEPQWESRDGQRFSARMQLIDSESWTEVKVLVDQDSIYISGRSKFARDNRGYWQVLNKGETGEKSKIYFFLCKKSDPTIKGVVRVPENSRSAKSLSELASV